MPRTTYNAPIIGELRDELDPHDEWFGCIETHFAICHAMVAHGEPVPAEWDFHPGAAFHESREDFLEDFGTPVAESVWDATEDQRRVAGRILHLWGEALHAAGRDY